ncbi:olfactory receptor 10C1-like [Lithobates pipiens]
MHNVNKTIVNEFLLVGFSSFQKFYNIIFYVVLLSYILCMLGNIAIIVLIRTHPALHIPMYFFITIFAFLEMMFASVTVPKLLSILANCDYSISVIGCFTQMYVLHALGETECFLLTLMSLDRYLAINNPLRYSTIMSNAFCYVLGSLSWIAGFIFPLVPAAFTILLEYCGPNEINKFFCDFAPLQNLACSDPMLSNYATTSVTITSVICPFFIIVVLYVQIIRTVLKIDSTAGKKKAFSTCSSHLIVSSLFFGTGIIVYIKPKGSQYDKFLALMYTIVTPMLNPFIYTLRNTAVKKAFRKSIRSFHELLSTFKSLSNKST